MSKVAVIVGRFQVSELTNAHKNLFYKILSQYRPDYILVGIGVSSTKFTRKNPLDWASRSLMINDFLGLQVTTAISFDVIPILDTENDKEWYFNLDSLICNSYPNDEVKLFGGRDSFLNKYKEYGGKFDFEEYPETLNDSGTEARKLIANNKLETKHFNKGIIYTVENQYPKVYPTVDIAIYNKQTREVLLGRKPNEELFRFIGGFVDPEDSCLEAAAAREAKEEANFSASSWAGLSQQFEYISSRKMNDYRYKGTGDCLHTTFFATEVGVSSNYLTPGDDIAELKWVNILHLFPHAVMPVHIDLANDFYRWFNKNYPKNLKSPQAGEPKNV
jgi:bifunctional NMN adenylyltransferase/nudix hydrolase